MISIKEYIRANQVMFFALIMGQLFFAAFAVVLVQVKGMNIGKTNLDEVFMYLVPIITLTGILGGFMVFRSKLALIKENKDLLEKFAQYRSVLIMRWALFEGPSFISIIAYLITSNFVYLVIAGLIIGVFLMTIPSRETLEKDLERTWEEKNKLGE